MGDWPLLNTLKAFQIHTSPKFNKTMEDLHTEAWQINFTPYACTYSVSSSLSPLEHIERWWRRSVWKSLMKHDEAKADLIIFFVRGTFLRALGKQLVLVAVFKMKLICLSNEKGLRYFPQIMLFIRNLWVRFLDYLPPFGKRACAHRLSLPLKSQHFLLRRIEERSQENGGKRA